jgi:hypothetical protein
VAQRFADGPGPFSIRALGNALDLFRLEYWPDNYARVGIRFTTVAKQLFLLAVIAPALVGFVLLLRRAFRPETHSAIPALLAGIVLALLLGSAASMGEPRYRIPFDGVFILLGAALYVGAAPGSRRFTRDPLPRWSAPLVVAAGGVSLTFVTLIVLVSHPSIEIGKRWPMAAPQPSVVIHRDANQFSEPKAAGSAWDAPGNYVFECEPACEELRVDFEHPVSDNPSVEIAADYNDRYRIAFYRAGSLVAERWVGASKNDGLRVERVRPGLDLEDPGFDAVGILPLYGDGNYSLGALRIMDGRAKPASEALTAPLSTKQAAPLAKPDPNKQ